MIAFCVMSQPGLSLPRGPLPLQALGSIAMSHVEARFRPGICYRARLHHPHFPCVNK